MDFELINIYSKELAETILEYVTKNKLITRQHNNTYWNKDGKLKYFLKDKYNRIYDSEAEEDESYTKTYTLVVFDDIVELRYLENRDNEDIFDTGIDALDVISVLGEVSRFMNIIFGTKIPLKKYKNCITKIYYEFYQATVHADAGMYSIWDKSFKDYNLQYNDEDYGIYTAEEFNDFRYVLAREFLPKNYYDTWKGLEKIEQEFIDNVIKSGDINKIEIVRPKKTIEQEADDKPIENVSNFTLNSFAEEAKRLSEQMSSIVNEMTEHEIGSLTKKQAEILNYIVKKYCEIREVPSIREMCKELGLKSPATLSEHIKNLENKGYITKDDKKRIIPLRDTKGNYIL